MSKSKVDFQIERIAFFSDAVFAIAITLLIIEIHAPVFKAATTSAEAFYEFVHLIPEFIAVLVSFALISMNWRRHHQLFGILNSYNGRLITLNFCSLAAVIFLPFSTAFLSKNWEHFWTNPIVLPFVVYSFNNLACAFFNYLLFRYALASQNELYESSEKFDAQRVKLEVMFPIFVFAVTTVVGYFNYFLALSCFALFALEPLFIKLVLRGKNGKA